MRPHLRYWSLSHGIIADECQWGGHAFALEAALLKRLGVVESVERCCFVHGLKDQLRSLKNKHDIDTYVIGCRKECDFSIKEGLRMLPHKVERQNKKIILLVMQALSAGKDLKSLKEHVRFVIEIKKRQLANIVQGLPGRVCGLSLIHI